MESLAVGEALTNLVWAKITSLSDVKASGNWMYAAKLDGEGAAMYDAAVALSEAMIELGIAIDGTTPSPLKNSGDLLLGGLFPTSRRLATRYWRVAAGGWLPDFSSDEVQCSNESGSSLALQGYERKILTWLMLKKENWLKTIIIWEKPAV